MSNFFLDEMDEFAQSSGNTYQYLSGNHMNDLDGCLLESGTSHEQINALAFTKINGYRKLSNDGKTFEVIKDAMFKCLEGFHYKDSAVGYFLQGNRDGINVYLAAEENGFAEELTGVIPELSMSTNVGISREEWKASNQYGGVITGRFDMTEGVMDQIIQTLHGNRCFIGILAKPLTKARSEEYKQELKELRERCESFFTISRSLGTASKAGINYTYPEVKLLSEYLDGQIAYYQEDNSGFWEYSLYFGSADKRQAELLGKVIKGVLSAYATNSEVGHCYLLEENPFYHHRLSLIQAEYKALALQIPWRLRKSALVSRVTSRDLAGLFQFPLESYPGIRVQDINKSSDSVNIFSKLAPRTGEEKLQFGKVIGTGYAYDIEYDTFRGHMLSIGATGEGKTNANMVILSQVRKKGIPFLVIEPAKRDYWHLISTIPNLRVYSPGKDALELRLNPLEPEDGIIISNHIEELMYAFSGAFDMETPVKLSLEGLLRYTYEKAGWQMSEVAYRQAKKYPTIADLEKNLEEYSRKKIRSGQEVSRDLEGAILRRVQYLSEGTMGSIVTGEENGITGKELANQSAVIELESLSVEGKAFVADLLLIKYNQYIRQRDAAHKLQRLVVLEEAHNIFTEEANNQAKNIAGKYFSDLLAEVREFGTGVIVSDQRSMSIHSAAIANTKIKVVGAIDNEADVDKVAFALRLNSFQKERIPELNPGEALVAVRGEKDVCKVKVNRHINEVDNVACIFCPCRMLCEKEKVKRSIMADTRRKLVENALYEVRFEPRRLKEVLESYLETLQIDKRFYLCALGVLLNESQTSELESRQMAYRYFRTK